MKNIKEKEDMKEITKKTKTVKKTQKEEKKEVAWPGSEMLTKKTDDRKIVDFIRTKDGKIVGRYTADYILGKNKTVLYDTTIGHLSINEIVKLAPTPEKLCDEFVLMHDRLNIFDDLPDPWHGRSIYSNYTDIICRNILCSRDPNLCNNLLVDEGINLNKIDTRKYAGRLFGGVWTKHGLEYVVKVNEKGEWEMINNNKKED